MHKIIATYIEYYNRPRAGSIVLLAAITVWVAEGLTRLA